MTHPKTSSKFAGRWAVFLDRDGTIVEERVYLSDPEQLALLPFAGDAIRLLNERGIPVFVVTNQAGVARGYFDLNRVHEVHRRLDELLSQQGAHIDRYYICPHHPTAGATDLRQDCQCRKPKPGLLLQAQEEWQLDLRNSSMIGDKWLDVEAGRSAGCKSFLVLTGYGREFADKALEHDEGHVQVAPTILDAVQRLLGLPAIKA